MATVNSDEKSTLYKDKFQIMERKHIDQPVQKFHEPNRQ